MATEPREHIALVFGIPTSRQEFIDRSNLSPDWDHGRSMAVLPGDPGQRFEYAYQQHVPAIEDVLNVAHQMRVDVLRRATLAMLRVALHSHDVVILVAHWRGSQVQATDPCGEWRSTLQRLLAEPTSPTGTALRQVTTRVDEFDRQALAIELNRLMERKALVPCLPAGLAGGVVAHPLMLRALQRDLIDAEFDGALKRGNQLELFDGLHTAADIGTALPQGFAGTFDLSCCIANVLSDVLRLQHGDAMAIVASTQDLPPGAHLRLVEGAMRIVRDCPGTSYLDARFACAQEMHDRRAQARRRHDTQTGKSSP